MIASKWAGSLVGTRRNTLGAKTGFNTSWFEVDKKGLAKLIDGKGKVIILHELLQNALDTGCKSIAIVLNPIEGEPACDLIICDDHPEGFQNLTHAYTLFAESEKKGDPTKRGRFNFGEKIVLALCEHASIHTTTGTVIFDSDGTRTVKRSKSDQGTVFNAKVRMTRYEYHEVCREIKKVIIPQGVYVTFNQEHLAPRVWTRKVEATLPTEIADEAGVMRTTTRKTDVELYGVEAGEKGWLYEMGIPVVEIDGPWHVNVMQKVPLNLQRDNVRPAYLRDLRVLVLNNLWADLTPEITTQPWVADALCDNAMEPCAVQGIITTRFGEKVVVADPSDREATNRAQAEGWTVIGGRTFSKDQWENIRRAEAIRPAGAVFPTPKPYSNDPSAKPVEVVPQSEWTDGMREVWKLSVDLGFALLNCNVVVRFVRTQNHFAACYAPGALDFNLNRLGHRWFDGWRGNRENVLDLIIHEFGHHYESNHLSEDYYKALTRLGAKMAVLALTDPAQFEVKL
jgi:hypothetical protein